MEGGIGEGYSRKVHNVGEDIDEIIKMSRPKLDSKISLSQAA